MKTNKANFEALLSDDVFIQASVASDVSSLARRLSRTRQVCELAQSVQSNPGGIASLFRFVEELIDEPYDPRYRHPKDFAICAALSVLGTVPLLPVRRFVLRLAKNEQTSLVWVRRMANECNKLFTEQFDVSTAAGFHVGVGRKPLGRPVRRGGSL